MSDWTVEQIIKAGKSLADVEQMAQYGTIDLDTLNRYLERWNATRGRLTIAKWRDGAIRQTTLDN